MPSKAHALGIYFLFSTEFLKWCKSSMCSALYLTLKIILHRMSDNYRRFVKLVWSQQSQARKLLTGRNANRTLEPRKQPALPVSRQTRHRDAARAARLHTLQANERNGLFFLATLKIKAGKVLLKGSKRYLVMEKLCSIMCVIWWDC